MSYAIGSDSIPKLYRDLKSSLLVLCLRHWRPLFHHRLIHSSKNNSNNNSITTMVPVTPPVILHIGSHDFRTNRETLTEKSAYFRALFSSDFASSFQADGSLFIDSDGDVFAHILTYLRHGIMPVLSDTEDGHDVQMYERVLDQAKYFQVQEIVDWIEKKSYEKHKVGRKVIHIDYGEVMVASDLTAKPKPGQAKVVSIQDVKSIGTRKTYLCASGQPAQLIHCAERFGRTSKPRRFVCECHLMHTLCPQTGTKLLQDSYIEEEMFLVKGKYSYPVQ